MTDSSDQSKPELTSSQTGESGSISTATSVSAEASQQVPPQNPTRPSHPDPDDFKLWNNKRSSWLIWATVASIIWFLVFSLGVLVDATPYREALGWKPKQEQQDALVREIAALVENRVRQNDKLPPADADPPPNADTPPSADPPPNPGSFIRGKNPFCNFAMGMITYLPLNIGLLTVLASFVGGCSVNVREVSQLWNEVAALDAEQNRSAEADRLRRRLNYLLEHPGYSAIRGLIIYLVVIAGLFLAGTHLFGEETQVDALTQYIKLAGLFSFLGYLAGFDPTVFTSMVDFSSSRVRPNPATSQTPGR